MRTLAAGDIVLAIDQQRHERWLATDDGQAYLRDVDAAILAALPLPPVPQSPPWRPDRQPRR